MAEKIQIAGGSWFQSIVKRFFNNPLGVVGLTVIFLFFIAAVYAPFLASSRPIVIKYDGIWYFPLFRYLFYPGFFSKGIDLFFNLMIFTFPLAIFACLFWNRLPKAASALFLSAIFFQLAAFAFLLLFPVNDPAADLSLLLQRQQQLKSLPLNEKGERPIDWAFTLRYLSSYSRLNLVVDDYLAEKQHEHIVKNLSADREWIPTLWQLTLDREKQGEAGELFLRQRRHWMEEEKKKITFILMPLIRPFHWEQDAAGGQSLNREVPFLEVTRINRKDLFAALVFGIRISLVVGFLAVSFALLLAIPIGAIAGFKGGTTDIVICRFMEIWESMPPFFMLLFVVAIAQTKSVLLVVGIIALFSWTGFARYLRGEMLKQRSFPYVEACYALGFSQSRIIFSHLLPNAIPPLLTLLPFAIMGAISSEAGLSFLGLGEEGSSSWGVLMEEGRSAFPSESYLLWPPALLLTTLLIAIALTGDALRDAIDPRSK